MTRVRFGAVLFAAWALSAMGCEEAESAREAREEAIRAEPPVATGSLHDAMGAGERIVPKLPTPQDQFMSAVRRGDRTEAERWLSKGADLGAGDAPLVAAIRGEGDVTFVRWLAGRGAAVDEADPAGRTPLSWAAGEADVETLALLLARGAQLDALDQLGRSPIYYAVFSGNDAVLLALLARGANPNVQDSLGATPLMYACAKNLRSAVAALDGAGADWNILDKLGRTAEQRAHGSPNPCVDRVEH